MAVAHRNKCILIVDNNTEDTEILREVLIPKYRVTTALDGETCLALAAGDSPPDLILLSLTLPVMDGYEVCRRLKKNQKAHNIPVIILATSDAVDDEELVFELGCADLISKPIRPAIVKARVSTHLALSSQLCAANDKQDCLETIHRLTQAVEYRDQDTVVHIQRMSKYAAAAARQLGLNEKTIGMILLAAPMHDIGKAGIPDHVLLKPSKLKKDEFDLMKQHTTIGAKILSGSQVPFIRIAETIALTHHEKWDGSGYPRGLKGNKIPLVGQLVAIADVFDALTTRRPFKEAFSLEAAFTIIREGRGTHFKPALVDAFLAIEKEIVAIKQQY